MQRKRHAELPQRSTFTRPEVYSAVAPGAPHTPKTQMDVSSLWRKKHRHRHMHMHIGAQLGLCLLLLDPVTHQRHLDQGSSG